MKSMERVLKALANKRRLAILKYLRNNRQATVGELAGVNRISMAATSRHLSILLAADLLEREQRSLEMYYRLSSMGGRVTNKILSIF